MSNKTIYLNDSIYNYLMEHSVNEHPVLMELRQFTSKLKDSAMQIAPEQGNFMQLIIKLIKAKNILEIGVYTGYSTLAMALALPKDGKIIACDVNEESTTIAKTFWKKAGVENLIDMRLAPAMQTLDHLLNSGGQESFDLIFIDADKTNYNNYYEIGLSLLKKGGLIIIDNTLWGGAVADMNEQDASTKSIRCLNDKLIKDQRIHISLLPLGDGITLAFKF